MSESTLPQTAYSDEEQQLRRATSRNASDAMDEETQSLQFAYASLADLLDRQAQDVDESTLIQAILDRELAPNRRARTESRAAALALAASLLIVLSLAGWRYSTRPDPLNPRLATTAPPAVTDAGDLAWDDVDWEVRLEDLHTSAAELHSPWLSSMESASWSTDESLREMQEELAFESL